MKDLNIVHTDLKPENMVINGVDPLYMKLIDYGSAEKVRSSGMPMYVCSRFYRSPDITFRLGYTCAHDCWSIGALLLEMHTGKILTQASSTPMLMLMFISFLGMPDPKFIMNGKSIRDKLNNLFVVSSDSFWRKHERVLTAYKIDKDYPFYPSEEVLSNKDSREQCKPR